MKWYIAREKIPPVAWAALTIVALLSVFFFGLRPKGLPSKNPVHVNQKEGSITFERYGVTYVEIDPSNRCRRSGKPEGLTIEMAVRAADIHKAGFRSLVMMHDGSDHNQLIVGQWKSSIIVMNGDDYDYRKRLPKLSAKDVFSTNEIRFVTIVSGKGKTQLFLDGVHAKTKAHWQLMLPGYGQHFTMVVGNSVTGKQSWTGELHYLALTGKMASPAAVKDRYDAWVKGHRFSFDETDHQLAVYTFDNIVEQRHIPDRSGCSRPLQVPSHPTVLKKQFLSAPWHDFKPVRSLFIDVLFNWIGFIPLGAFFFGWLDASPRWLPGRYRVFATVLLCFSLSLGIEIAQAWMPTRSSSFLDLSLNTLGAWMGTWLIVWIGDEINSP